MRVSEIMSKEPATIAMNTTLMDAAQKMQMFDIGALPVVEEGHVKGMLTDRDIVIRGLAEGKDPSSTAAHDVMTTDVFCVFEDQDITEAVASMRDQQIRRLPVLDRADKLVGVVSLGNLCCASEDEHMTAGLARCVSEPAATHATH